MAARGKQGHVTIKDIATVLGMAHSTVSRALNDHPHINARTKMRVRREAERLGYVANSGARLLQSGSSRLVGLIVPDIQNEFYGMTAKVMSEYCASAGFQLMLAGSDDNPEQERQQLQALREARVDGVLIAATAEPRRATLRMLGQLPTVQFLRRHPRIVGHSIGADDFQGILSATAHLADLGHRRIGYVGGPETLSTGKGRAAGYREAMARVGLPIENKLMHLGPRTPEFGKDALAALLDRPQPPTAVVIASSRLVVGALETMNARHLSLPEDLSLVAYSDLDWFRVWKPGITAVALPVADMVAAAVALLFREIQQRHPGGTEAHAPFEPMLNVRGTTAALLAPHPGTQL